MVILFCFFPTGSLVSQNVASGAGTANHYGAHESIPIVCMVRVAKPFIFCL